jgi:hypothetical protein
MAKTAATKQTRQRKPIPSADALSPESYAAIEAAAKSLSEFVELENALRTMTVKPSVVVKSRDEAWSRFYKKMKQSEIFKGKRKPVSDEMVKLNRKKGEALAEITKQLKLHNGDENHASVKSAKQSFKNVMKEIKDLTTAEKVSKKSK